MMRAGVDILVLEPMLPSIESALDERFTVHRVGAEPIEHLLERVGDRIRGVVAGRTAWVKAPLMDGLRSLELVARYGAGYERIDAQHAAARGIVVTNTPGVMAPEVADLAMGLLLCAVRQIPQADAYVRARRWGGDGRFPLTATLRGRQVGIVGLGTIGKAVARRCTAFDLDVSYFGRQPQSGQPYRYFDSLVQMASAVDVLFVCASGGAATRHLVNEPVLHALGPQGIVVNVARGSLIDEEALVQALEQGTILTAALDVLEFEPNVPPRLLAMPHVVLTPHVGSGSRHTVEAMGELLVRNIESWFAGQGPLTPVPETPWRPAQAGQSARA